MKKFLRNLIIGFTALTAVAAVGVSLGVSKPSANQVDAAVSKTVTKVYVEGQVTSVPVLAIESISFDSSAGYGHTQWREF